jgi:hypothetical protein
MEVPFFGTNPTEDDSRSDAGVLAIFGVDALEHKVIVAIYARNIFL